MNYKTKLKIGEFSQLMQVTVKTLRHYESYIPASIHNEAMLSGAWTSIAQ